MLIIIQWNIKDLQEFSKNNLLKCKKNSKIRLTETKKCCNIYKQPLITVAVFFLNYFKKNTWAISSGGRALDF